MKGAADRLGRAVVVGAVLFFAWLLFVMFVYEPYRCNAALKTIQSRTDAAFAGSKYSTAIIARRNLNDLAEFKKSCATNVSYHVIVGINDELLNRHADAVREFRTAIYLNARPEIYVNLGAAELNCGNQASAIADFVLACRFTDRYRSDVPAEIADAVNAQLRTSR